MTAVDAKFYPLIAMCQAAQLAIQLATLGNCDEPAFHAMVDSLFVFDPLNTEAVYGNHPKHLDLGLLYFGVLNDKPTQPTQKLALQLIYSFLRFAKKIVRAPKVQSHLKTQLIRIHEQIDYFGAWNHPRVLNNLADLYVETATYFRLRLKISGQKKYLQDPETIHKIRTVLFSGVRAAVLWYQLNGNFLWFFWHRKQLLRISKTLIQNLRGQA